MLIRRFPANYLLFRRLLVSSAPRVPYQLVRKISKRVIVLTSALTITSSYLYRQHLTFCEEKLTNMAEIKEADELYDTHKFKELYDYLMKFKDSEDPELLWRAVRAYRDRATMEDVSKDDKKTIIFEAFEISKRAIELGEDNYACHKWYGIMLSQTGDYLGTKNKIENSPAMKKHFERAIELCPEDSTSHHLLGMWCFSFADLAWYERKIAGVVFGTPPNSTYEEALAHFVKAEEMSPGFYSNNQYMIGLVHLKMGNKAEAKEWFQKLKSYKVVKDEDKANVKKAEDQLKSF